MTDRLMEMLVNLTQRERGLLLVLLLVALPLGVYFSAAQPLIEARRTARIELGEAQALRAWIEARSVEIRRLSDTAADRAPEPIGVSGIEQSLIAARLRSQLSDLSRRGTDEIDLRFDAVAFTDLGQWLTTATLSWGYDITAFTIERGTEPGIVSAAFTLRPRV